MGFALPIIGPWLLKRGIKGALSTGIQIGVVVLLLAALWFLVVKPIKGHFDHINELEVQNEQLKAKNVRLEAQRDQLIQTNKDNEAQRQLNQQIEANNERIAGEERAAAAARAATYKEIGNAIRNTPTQPAQPGRPAVAPVVTDTLDRLWGRHPARPGN
jgi:hypothetical protein